MNTWRNGYSHRFNIHCEMDVLPGVNNKILHSPKIISKQMKKIEEVGAVWYKK